VVCLSESWNGEDIWILISLREREKVERRRVQKAMNDGEGYLHKLGELVAQDGLSTRAWGCLPLITDLPKSWWSSPVGRYAASCSAVCPHV
jgi:hypothetical protein